MRLYVGLVVGGLGNGSVVVLVLVLMAGARRLVPERGGDAR